MGIIRKICINCPAGCHLEISETDNVLQVFGNRCPRGVKYAERELHNPGRIVTASVRADISGRVYVPVKSSAPVPLRDIKPLLAELAVLRVAIPVHTGDVVIKNFNDLNIDIIATGDFE